MSNEKKSGGTGVIIFSFFLVLAIFAGAWGYLIRTNKFFNLGEKLRPYIKDIPVVNMILPLPLDEADPTVYSRTELEEFYKTLTLTNKSLTEKNSQLEKEMIELKLVEEKNTILLAEIESLKKTIKDYESQYDAEQEAIEKAKKDRLNNLIKTYESMEAAEAAAILEEMGTLNISLVMEICNNMKSSSLSEIMQEMDKDFAAILSERLIEE